MASFLPPAVFEIKAIADQAIAKFKEVDGELDKMGKQAESAGGKISGIDNASKIATAGVLAMGAAFVGFAAFGIKEANEAEQALNKLGITLSNFGVNTAATRAKVEQLTGAYVDLGFGGEEAAAGYDVLFRATGDLDKAQALLATSADLARVKNISLADASSIVAKASMGGAKAFKEMGITLDTTLPKAQAIDKAMAELNAKIGGQAVAYTETFAGQMVVMKEKFADVAETLGTTLLPYLKKFLDGIIKTVAWIKQNSSWLSVLAGAFVTVTVALASYNAYIKISAALTKAWTAVTTIQKTVTAMMTGQQLALNAAMTVNPIGLVVAAAVLLIGALILLWNKSETFRKMMIQIGKVGIKAFGFLLGVIGDLAVGLIKIATGPLKLLLKGLSLLGVDAAGKALKGLEGATEGVGKFFDSAAKKVTGMAASLDKLNKPIKLTFSTPKIPKLPNVGGATGGGDGGAGAKASAAAKAEVKKNNEGYMKIVADFNDKVVEAKTKFADTMISLENNYQTKVRDLNKKASEDIAKATKDAENKKIKLRSDAADKIDKLEKDAAAKKLKIEKDTSDKIAELQKKFNETMGNLNKKKAEDLEKAAIDNGNKLEEITKAGQDKLESIVSESVNRLRSAFASGTAFKVGDIFKGLKEAGAANIDGLLKSLKDKLAGAKQLAANAAALQAKGFSQTFIEQVVSSGPEIGNSLADSILNANPETVKELQATFVDLESTSEDGLNVLAQSMNVGGRLATKELTKAYQDAQKETAAALVKQNQDYLAAQKEINKGFNDAMKEAEKDRDTSIAQAQKDMAEAIAEVDKVLAASIAEINADLAKALAEIDAELAETLASINTELMEALAEAETEFADATKEARDQLAEDLAAIQKDFDDKLGKITDATKATIAAITALKSAMASASALTVTSGGGGGGGGGSLITGNKTPIVVTPVKPVVPVIPSFATAGAKGYEGMTQAQVNAELLRERGNKISVTVNTTNATSPTAIATSVVNEIKFGTVNTTTLAGIMAASGSGGSGGGGRYGTLVD
jgi:hypothetical protein